MCGIYGVIGTIKPANSAQMGQALRHRGPDDAGEFSEGSVTLGHRRLAIVDLAGGRQPMDDGEAVVVFNGEIYNHRELKQRFETAGRRYHTRSDTESILQAYRAYGTDCLEHLQGMFAFVLYDRKRQMLFGARDRFGEKPLYYAVRPAGGIRFAFASEVKALRQCSAIASRCTLGPSELASYLQHDYIVGNSSPFQDVVQLGPGEAFTVPLAEIDAFRKWRWWKMSIGLPVETGRGKRLSLTTVGVDILALLAASVDRCQMSDVPVGVLLSGGLDSSTITALSQQAGGRRLKTFSIGFRESSYDESRYAREVAEHFGTEHFERQFTPEDLIEQVSLVAGRLDEPFADPSILPTSMLCQLAAEHVKVVIGGDGADELFAGYDTFKALAAARWYNRLVPNWLHRTLASAAVGWIPDTDRHLSLAFKLARFLRGVRHPAASRTAAWMGAFTPDQIARLLPDSRLSIRSAAPTGSEPSSGDSRNSPDVDHALAFYLQSYLPHDILVKVDRASMLHSLEVRSPFLDATLADYVNRLPAHYKFHRGETKYVFKRAVIASGLLPPHIVRRRKKGFGIPVARWMRVELHDYFRDALIEDWPASLEMIDQREIRRLWEEHSRRTVNRAKELWALFMLAQWARHCMDSTTAGNVASAALRISA